MFLSTISRSLLPQRSIRCRCRAAGHIELQERGEHATRGRVVKPCNLKDAMKELQLSTDDLDLLIKLGAIYKGRRIKGQDVIKWTRIIQPSAACSAALLEQESLIRVHPHPKRYPVCDSTDWRSRVAHQDDELLIVNKPPGLPCMPHESNSYEELAGCVSRGLGIPDLEV